MNLKQNLVYADVNKVMDKCSSCGGHPGWEWKRVGDKAYYRGHCCDCCETGPYWEENVGMAYISWNKQQREQKAKSVHIGDTKVITQNGRG